VPSFEDLTERSRTSPFLTNLPPLSQFYLDDVAIYDSIENFEQDLYDPDHRFQNDVVIDTETRHPDYDWIHCSDTPFRPALNNVIKWTNNKSHTAIQQELLSQSEIQDYLLNTVGTAELVVLVIVDGLSYNDVKQLDVPIQPVFVDGFTTTQPGYRRVIYGDGGVSMYAHLLKEKQFYDAYGFTYWERGQEDLSTDLHASMGDDIHQIRDFSEAVSILQHGAPLDEKTYVQITRMGFDQDSHNRKEKPAHDAIRGSLVDDLRSLCRVASELTDNYQVFVTSDHGIIWRDDLPDDPPIVSEDWQNHARFVQGDHDLEYGFTIDVDGEPVTALGYPGLTRDLKNTEWGVHGGFSYQESLVPLIELTPEETL
jgi:hypothetical protein